MIKRLMYVALAFAMTLGLTGKVDEVSAEEEIGKCEIKIDANVHKGSDNGKYAVPEGYPGCDKLGVGWYDNKSGFAFDGNPVYNGKVVEKSSLGTKYYKYHITVKTIPPKKQSEPKPAPKKENKPKQQPKPKPQPKQESKTKQQQTKPKQESKPKQQSQPKVQHKSQSKQENKPKQQVQNTQKTAQSKQVAKAETKKDENIKKKEEKFKTEEGSKKEKEGSKKEKEESKKEKEEPKKEKENEEKGKKLSVAELKSKNAEVVKEGNKFYAVYKDEEGKEVKQEISEEEAKGLGYKEKVETAEPVKEETEETPVEKKEDDDKKSSKMGVIAGTAAAVLAGLGGGGYFIFRKFF